MLKTPATPPPRTHKNRHTNVAKESGPNLFSYIMKISRSEGKLKIKSQQSERRGC